MVARVCVLVIKMFVLLQFELSESNAEKQQLTQEMDRLVRENQSLSSLVQEMIQENEEAIRRKDAEIQRLQVCNTLLVGGRLTKDFCFADRDSAEGCPSPESLHI